MSHKYVLEYVTSKKQLKECYKLRYRVYCEEHEWEPPNSKKEEKDEWDEICLHILIRDVETNTVVATGRLIPFPNNIAEVSRFINTSRDEEVVRLLLQGLVIKSRENKIEQWFVMIRKSLARLLKKYGVICKPVGVPINYRGIRYPMIINVNEYEGEV